MTDRSAIKRGGAILSILILLITAAFFAPQILFRVQDAVLCKDTILKQQESMNVEALSTTYERSLAVRMQNYAEGLADGDTFYVTSQNLTITNEMTEYLYSSSGVYSELINRLVDMNVLHSYIWGEIYGIIDWKQYVIYSDDFTKGVNFILWYIEIQDENGLTLKLLADAEDGTIYAVKTEENSYLTQEETEVGPEENYIDTIFWNDDFATSIWGFYAMIYEAMDESQRKSFEILMYEYGWTGDGIVNSMNASVNNEDAETDTDSSYVKEKQTQMKEALSLQEELAEISEMVQYYMQGSNTVFFLLPYGDAKLDVVMKIPASEKTGRYLYGIPDILVGIRQIYEMIPEFA